MSAAPDPLSALVRDAQARWGSRALQRGVTRSPLTSGTTLATGIPELDALLPAGGPPRGALSVTARPLTSGKTTLALRTAATAQAAGEQVMWFDLPGTFDPHAAVRWQVSLPARVLVRPQAATEALEILADVLRAGAAGLVVLSQPLSGWPGATPSRHSRSLLRRASWGVQHSRTFRRVVRVVEVKMIHQAPPSARGVHFITLEDEDGMLNIVMWPRVYAAQRVLLRQALPLLGERTVQRRDGVTNVVAQKIRRLEAGWTRSSPTLSLVRVQ